MTTDRRTFLATLGATALGALACRTASAGTDLRGRKIARVGLQLYTVRDAMQRDLPGTLARVAKIGYREVEFAGYFGRSPADIRRLVADLGLTAPSSHIPYPVSMDAWSKAVDDAKAAGHQYATIPWLAEQSRRSAADIERTADVLNQAARRAHDAGLRFAYHQHDFEFRALPGSSTLPFDILLQRTDPALVNFEMDLYWITKAGQSPIAYFDRYPGRFTMVHVKDATAAPAREMAPVGQGTIDFAGIFRHDAEHGAHIEHYFVEHDQPADPFASITTSYAALSRLTF